MPKPSTRKLQDHCNNPECGLAPFSLRSELMEHFPEMSDLKLKTTITIGAFTLEDLNLGFCQTQTWTFCVNLGFSKPAREQVCEGSNPDSCNLSWWFTLVWS